MIGKRMVPQGRGKREGSEAVGRESGVNDKEKRKRKQR